MGIRSTVTAIDHAALDVDFDITVYTQYGRYSWEPVGLPTFGLPAVDYGDGGTLRSTVLDLVSPGGGPGGANVFRGSFRHTYPTAGTYSLRVGSDCCVGFFAVRHHYPSSFATVPTSTSTIDRMPDIVTGTPALTSHRSGLGHTYFGVRLMGFSVYEITALSNLATHRGSPSLKVGFSSAPDVPMLSERALLLLGFVLASLGVQLLRR